jgi:hypothetical protein
MFLALTLLKLLKDFNLMQNSGCHGNQKKKSLKNSSKTARARVLISGMKYWLKYWLVDPLSKLFNLYSLGQNWPHPLGVIGFHYLHIILPL